MWFDRAVRIACVVWLAAHFALTIAYVTPLNPSKLRGWPLIEATIGAYFPQNWSFFAPNPVAADEALLCRCLTGPERPQAGTLPTDGWADLSTPAWQAYQRNRFTAYDRLARPQTSAIRQYLSGGIALGVFRESCEKGFVEACKTFEEGLKAAREDAGRYLRRMGSSFCREIGPERAYGWVALRVRITPARPWSQRGDRTPRPFSDVDLGVYPIDESVAPSGLFRKSAP